ncbi:MAG: hypothetical protein LBK66_15280 [Spirochaetaceae bacterium]|nr:hypothetical protein [Spirochaetaceae bacterium]
MASDQDIYLPYGAILLPFSITCDQDRCHYTEYRKKKIKIKNKNTEYSNSDFKTKISANFLPQKTISGGTSG